MNSNFYPVLNENNKLVGQTTIPQNGCCYEELQNELQKKENLSSYEEKILSLKPLKKIPPDIDISPNDDGEMFFEDGEFIRKKI